MNQCSICGKFSSDESLVTWTIYSIDEVGNLETENVYRHKAGYVCKDVVTE